MSKQEIFLKIKDILKQKFVFNEEEITIDSSLIETFVMDSLQLLEFIISVEEEFKICMKPEDVDVETFNLLSTLVEYIYKQINVENSYASH